MSTNTRSINNINQNNNNSSSSSFPSSSDPYNNRIDNTSNCNDDNNNNNNIAANSTGKRKRRPAGTPDPDAEVVSLSPRTLLESDRYVCEICNQGFQRDQNLQMHRRRHKVPWKLLKRSDHHDPADATGGGAAVMRKRVFVCPEPTCLHHDPRHALGDLVGIKKHFRRKHSNHKQWACGKCSKAYAVHSDFKAHLKTCGTRGHSCDCGRVFSRVESFIEHQDTCHMGRLLRPPGHHITPQPTPHQQPPSTVCLSRTPSSPSSDTNHNPAAAALPWVGAIVRNRTQHNNATTFSAHHLHNLDLQLSIGSSDVSDKNESSVDEGKGAGVVEEGGCSEGAAKAQEMLKLAMAEMAYAEEARREAKRQIEIAESEFASAKKIRQQALAELEKAQALKAQALKEQAVKKINSTLMQITCHACKHKIQLSTDASAENGDRNP